LDQSQSKFGGIALFCQTKLFALQNKKQSKEQEQRREGDTLSSSFEQDKKRGGTCVWIGLN